MALQHPVHPLRAAVGRWNVVTDLLGDDGSVPTSVQGADEFSWVVPCRVVAGRSKIPELKQTSGILFYFCEAKHKLQLASVGGDGQLWIMTGPPGGEERLSQECKTSDGGAGRLRCTRSNVSTDAFESRMDCTHCGGRTWKPVNHQHFTRVVSSGG